MTGHLDEKYYRLFRICLVSTRIVPEQLSYDLLLLNNIMNDNISPQSLLSISYYYTRM